MRKRQLIIVEWDDISGDNEWHREDDLGDCHPHSCHSVGWRMASDRKFLRLASTRSEVNKCVDITAIPRGCIKSIRKLK